MSKQKVVYNMLNLLSDSLADATMYANELNSYLKETETEEKQVANVKEEKKRKTPHEKRN